MSENVLTNETGKLNGRKIFLLALGFAVSIIASLYQGFAAWALWGWFITPSFAIVAPSVVALAGIALFVKLLAYHISLGDFKLLIDKEQPNATYVRWLGILVSFFVSTSFLLGGWILSWFM